MSTSEQQAAAAAKRATKRFNAAKRAAAPSPPPSPAPARPAVPKVPTTPSTKARTRLAPVARIEVWGGKATARPEIGEHVPAASNGVALAAPDGLYAAWRGQSIYLGARGLGGHPADPKGRRVWAAIAAGTWDGVA